MLGHGDVDFLDDKLDFNVRPGVLLTPVYKLLEYAGTGSLKKLAPGCFEEPIATKRNEETEKRSTHPVHRLANSPRLVQFFLAPHMSIAGGVPTWRSSLRVRWICHANVREKQHAVVRLVPLTRP